jgi:hypothetical protein
MLPWYNSYRGFEVYLLFIYYFNKLIINQKALILIYQIK